MSDSDLQDDIKRYYDESSYYEDVWKEVRTPDDLLSPHFQRYRLSKLKQLHTPGAEDRVLDLGCALGGVAFGMSPLCREVIGSDYSEKAIRKANELLEAGEYSNVRFVCSDAQSLDLPSESIEVIFCADLLEHLYAEVSERVYDECERLLVKGGRLAVWTPNRGHIFEILRENEILLKRDVSHVDYKSKARMEAAFLARGFAIEKSYYSESHLVGFNLLERWLQPFIPMMRRRIGILARKPS